MKTLREFLYGAGAAALLLAVLTLLCLTQGCASMGFYAMDDRWCEAHADAKEYQCPGQVLARATTYCEYGEHPGDSKCVAVKKQVTLILVPVQPPQHYPTYETLNEAAVVGLAASYKISHYYEVGGVILKMPDGTFAVARPRTDVSGDSLSKIDMDPMGYPGEIVASYHTHPCNSNTHVPSRFSPEDMQSDRTYKSIGFKADLCTGKVTMYDPSVDKISREESDEGWEGHQVGTFIVDGVVLDENLGVALD